MEEANLMSSRRGLLGRIWATAQPAWIPNVAEDTNFLRTMVAVGAGLHGAFGFPILIGDEVIGALEFFNREIWQPDGELLKMMTSVGGQIGQFQVRKRAEGELQRALAMDPKNEAARTLMSSLRSKG